MSDKKGKVPKEEKGGEMGGLKLPTNVKAIIDITSGERKDLTPGETIAAMAEWTNAEYVHAENLPVEFKKGETVSEWDTRRFEDCKAGRISKEQYDGELTTVINRFTQKVENATVACIICDKTNCFYDRPICRECSTLCGSCLKPNPSLQRCSRCHLVHYCSVECQKKHWPKHKSACKLMKMVTENSKAITELSDIKVPDSGRF